MKIILNLFTSQQLWKNSVMLGYALAYRDKTLNDAINSCKPAEIAFCFLITMPGWLPRLNAAFAHLPGSLNSLLHRGWKMPGIIMTGAIGIEA